MGSIYKFEIRKVMVSVPKADKKEIRQGNARHYNVVKNADYSSERVASFESLDEAKEEFETYLSSITNWGDTLFFTEYSLESLESIEDGFTVTLGYSKFPVAYNLKERYGVPRDVGNSNGFVEIPSKEDRTVMIEGSLYGEKPFHDDNGYYLLFVVWGTNVVYKCYYPTGDVELHDVDYSSPLKMERIYDFDSKEEDEQCS